MLSSNLEVYYKITISFVVVLILSKLPLPLSWKLWKPEWFILVLFYWVLVLPSYVGPGFAFLLGLILDVMFSNLLGLQSFSLTLLAYFSNFMLSRIKIFVLLQQCITVAFLVFMNQWICLFGNNLYWQTHSRHINWRSMLISAVLWPILLHVLYKYQCKYIKIKD